MWNQMTLVKVSYSPRVCRCVDFSVFVFRREILSFILTKRGGEVNIQTWGGGNIRPTLFYPGTDCCFCQLASLREPAKLSSPSIFIHWHSAPRQLEVQAHSKQAREGGWVLFFLPLLLQQQKFFLADWQHHHFNPVEVLGDGVIWRGWKRLGQKYWRGTSTFVI